MAGGFTVPNATDYALGDIASLDQAEPDSLDFQFIGDRRHGIISGGLVTSVTNASGNATPAYLNVTLDAVEVRIGNTYGTISGSTVVIPAPPVSGDARFDLIVAYNNLGTFQFDVVQGTESSTNPVFPTLASNDTQIPLYAVYVKTTLNSSFTTELLVDKRTFTSSSLSRVAAGAPSVGTGAIGDVYVNSTVSGNVGQSQVYVKTGASTWMNLAQYVATTSANTPSTVVYRDASGNFSAGTVTATSFSGSGASLTSIPGSALNSGSVTATQLGSGAVTTDKLATGAPRAGFNSTRSSLSSNYTVATSDVGKLLEFNAGSGTITVTVPGTGFNDGDRIDLLQISATGSNVVTVAGAGGVTVDAEGGRKTLKGQWSAATLINRGTNTWVLIGSLIA